MNNELVNKLYNVNNNCNSNDEWFLIFMPCWIKIEFKAMSMLGHAVCIKYHSNFYLVGRLIVIAWYVDWYWLTQWIYLFVYVFIDLFILHFLLLSVCNLHMNKDVLHTLMHYTPMHFPLMHNMLMLYTLLCSCINTVCILVFQLMHYTC